MATNSNHNTHSQPQSHIPNSHGSINKNPVQESNNMSADISSQLNPQHNLNSIQAQLLLVDQLQSSHYQSVQPVGLSGSSSRGCNCKKSKCMKMYCECYLSGIACSQNCKCLGCENMTGNGGCGVDGSFNINNDQFDNSNNANGNACGNVNGSGSNRRGKVLSRGCNCKKSQCSKKYCECFNAGIFCNTLCKCEQCKNILNGQNSQQNQCNQVSQSGSQSQQPEHSPLFQTFSIGTQQQNQQAQLKNKEISCKLDSLLQSVQQNQRQSMLEFMLYLLN